MYSSFFSDFVKNDTTLRLDGFGYGTRETFTGNNQTNNGGRGTCPTASDDVCKLVLGLGPTPSVYSDDHYGNKSNHGLSSQPDSLLKLGLSGDAHAVSNDQTPSNVPSQACLDGSRIGIPVVDEGSTSAKKSGGCMTQLILAPRLENSEMLITNMSHCQTSQLSSEPSAFSNYSMSALSEPGSAAVSSNSRGNNARKCMFNGCTKGARGATGLCIGHGGGQRCQKPGCNKGAESRTAYCKAHGGGRRCQHLGCTKSAEGSTDHCIAHGGGRRCGHPEGCMKAARGKSGLCIKHGGGKRCTVEGCSRSAEGKVGLCISHGGGRRCQFLECPKGAQGSTEFCKAHGGGKRCVFSGCTKGAEGSTPLCKGHGGGKRCLFDGGGICPKSVHGGTNYCVAHGGGKRCAVPGCTKSARGRTDCCVKHGGGKRCQAEKCGKSAQGSSSLCKGHGGGKRCSWAGEGKCEKFARGKSGLCAAHTSLVEGRLRKKGGMIGPGLFHGLVSTCSSSGASVISDSLEKRKLLIPPQVLVPLSMKAVDAELVVPEGRVHGGGLLSLLGGDLNNGIF